MRTTYTKNEIRCDGQFCTMDIYNRKCDVIAQTTFDCVDKPRVEKFKWCLHVGYVFTNVDGHMLSLHRLIMKTRRGYVVDHINRNKLDNRSLNLRNVRQSNNALNNSAVGVSKTPNAKTWRAYIGRHGKQIHLGCFPTFEEALATRRKAHSNELRKLGRRSPSTNSDKIRV